MDTLPKITVSSGDMTLALLREKTLHFVRAAEPFTPGQTVMLVRKTPESTEFSIPVVITEASFEHRNSPLDRLEQRRAGRITATHHKPLSPEVRAQRWREISKTLGKRIAKQFVAHMEEALPEDIYASAIAGDGSLPVQRISFTLKLAPDEELPLPELMRKYQVAANAQSKPLRNAHQYRHNNHGVNGEFMAPPEAPDLWAMRYLEKQGPANIESLVGRLYEPYEMLSQMQKRLNEYRHLNIPTAGPDGIQRELAGLPSIPCSLDTGTIAVMNKLNRLAVRTPLPTAGTGQLTAVLYATGKGNAISSHRNDFQVPVELDTTATSTRQIPSILLTGNKTIFSDAAAREHGHSSRQLMLEHYAHEYGYATPKEMLENLPRDHGFASANDMLNALAIHNDEQCTILSYPVKKARVESIPLNTDRAGKHEVNRKRHALTALQETPEGKRARNFLKGMDTTERAEALASITPPSERTEEMAQAAGPIPMNAKGTRQLPNDVIAAREQENSSASKKKKPQRQNNGHKHEKKKITLQGGFEELPKALERAERRDAPRPKRLKSEKKSPLAPEYQGLSPVITTEDATLPRHHRNREGLDEHGEPISKAPKRVAQKDPEKSWAEKEASKPRGKKPERTKPGRETLDGLSRRDDIRAERRQAGETLRDMRLNPERADEYDTPLRETWEDFLLTAPASRGREK